MKTNIASELVSYVILLVALLGSIMLTFDQHGLVFYGSLLVLGLILFISLIAIIGMIQDMEWSWGLLLGLYILIGLHSIFLFAVSSIDMFIFQLIAVSALIGFFVALMSMKRSNDGMAKSAIALEEKESMKESRIKPPKAPVKAKFSPGKYVASKFGNTFHAAKCEWANNIKPANRVWFESKDEAKKAGNKAHECV